MPAAKLCCLARIIVHLCTLGIKRGSWT